MKTKPTLLVCDEMISSIISQIDAINNYTAPTVVNYFFVYALFEGLLRNICFQLYYAFPAKLEGQNDDHSSNANDKCTIKKSELLKTNDYYYLLNCIIDSKLDSISKGSLYDYLKFFFKLSGAFIDLDQEFLEKMTKARNIIAHDCLLQNKPWNNQDYDNIIILNSVNDDYLDDNEFYEKKNKHAILSKDSIYSYIQYLLKICNLLKNELKDKYQRYTYEKLLIDAWNYTCPPIVPIYKIFSFDSGSPLINFESAVDNISILSSSEKYILSIWLSHCDINTMYSVMSKVGTVNLPTRIALQHKLLFLNQLFREFPLIVNGQKYQIENGKIKV